MAVQASTAMPCVKQPIARRVQAVTSLTHSRWHLFSRCSECTNSTLGLPVASETCAVVAQQRVANEAPARRPGGRTLARAVRYG